MSLTFKNFPVFYPRYTRDGVQYVKIPGPFETHGEEGIEMIASDFDLALRKEEEAFQAWKKDQDLIAEYGEEYYKAKIAEEQWHVVTNNKNNIPYI